MASINLKVSRPRLFSDFNAYDDAISWTWGFTVELSNPHHQEVKLTLNESLTNVSGRLGFLDADSSDPHKSFAKGSLSYLKGSDDVISPSGSSFIVSIRLPKNDLDRLTETILNGMSLKSVSIDVPIDYGWAPDGSVMNWDNASHPTVEVEGYRLSFGEAEEQEIEPEPAEDSVDTVAKSLRELRRIKQDIRLAIYLAFFLFMVTALRSR
jgi:hypothetical protein